MINKIKKEKLIKQNGGQIAIIVLLVSAVLLTIGLSASKKTVTETKIETDESLLKEAFNTAESAINNYLVGGGGSYTSGNSSAAVTSSSIGGADSLSSEGQVLTNSNQLFWLVNHNDDGSIGTDYFDGIRLGLETDFGFNGALKIDYFYIDIAGEYQVKRWGCNYDSSKIISGFTDKSACQTIDLPSNKSLLLSITPLGSATSLTLSSDSSSYNFPLQGEELTSVGTVAEGIKTQIKTRNVYQIPLFFIDAVMARNVIE